VPTQAKFSCQSTGRIERHYTPAGIIDVIAHGKIGDWTTLHDKLAESPALVREIFDVCEAQIAAAKATKEQSGKFSRARTARFRLWRNQVRAMLPASPGSAS
jgi:hypothetical protein